MKHKFKILTYLFVAVTTFLFTHGCTTDRSSPPILILATDNGFGSYTGEILKAEGFNAFRVDSLPDTKIKLKYLKKFDIIILTESLITPAQKEMFSVFVKEGGNLIAFKPDRKLAEVFGIVDEGDTFSKVYLSINQNSGPGKGITSETIKLNVPADKYKLNGSIQLAELFIDGITGSGYPGVVINNYGKGHAISFLYNLPENIVLTRQGNHLYAAEEKDGINGLRPMDLFTDGWVDTSKNTINQADEQMRLLSHCIENLSAYTRPIPRFWYFPDALKCLATLTNDGENSREADFEPQFLDVDAKGAKMTLYVLEIDKISKEWVSRWVSKGHEISGHPDDVKQAGNPDWNTMDSAIKLKLKELNDSYGITAMHTTTNHWFVWCGKNADGTKDFAAQARIEEQNGIGLDCNYAHYDNNSNQGHFLGSFGYTQGNYTSSGLVMKFADTNGKMINVYNQLNNVYDQQYMEHKDQEGFFNCFKGLMDRSLDNEVYSYICIRAHNNEYFFSKIPLMNMLDYANNKGVPVWTEKKLLDFLKAKDEATFDEITWKDNRLSFEINSSLNHDSKITCMIPNTYNGKKITKITSNGEIHNFTVNSIKGFDYAWLTVKPGSTYSMVVSYF